MALSDFYIFLFQGSSYLSVLIDFFLSLTFEVFFSRLKKFLSQLVVAVLTNIS